MHRTHALELQEIGIHLANDGLGDLVLECQDIAEVAIVLIGPDVSPRGRVDQLNVDANSILRLPDAADHDVLRVQLQARLLDVLWEVWIEGRRACDHGKAAPASETRDEILGEPVGEDALLGIPAEVLEGEHRDGGAGCQARGPIGRRTLVPPTQDRQQSHGDRRRYPRTHPARDGPRWLGLG